jgi:hypothetical protein
MRFGLKQQPGLFNYAAPHETCPRQRLMLPVSDETTRFAASTVLDSARAANCSGYKGRYDNSCANQLAASTAALRCTNQG